MKLGEKIRNLRLKLGLTQEELAERSDLTKGFISQLERDNTSPSVDTLEHIVRALGTNMADFFREAVKQPVLYRRRDAVMLRDDDLKHNQYFIVADAQSLVMEPVLLELDHKGRSRAYPPYEGEVFGYVLQGHLKLSLGSAEYVLEAQDCFYFAADDEFYVENKGKGQARLLWVLSPPNF